MSTSKKYRWLFRLCKDCEVENGNLNKLYDNISIDYYTAAIFILEKNRSYPFVR